MRIRLEAAKEFGEKKYENVMQRYIESNSNIINHQPSNYFGLSFGATPWIFTK